MVVLVGIIALNFILFFRKQLFTGSCDLETLLKDRGVTLSSKNLTLHSETVAGQVDMAC